MHLVRLHWPAGCNDSVLLGISEMSSFPEMESISSPFVVRVAMHVPKTMTGWVYQVQNRLNLLGYWM